MITDKQWKAGETDESYRQYRHVVFAWKVVGVAFLFFIAAIVLCTL